MRPNSSVIERLNETSNRTAFVSVVMPLYNEEKYIERCILSLVNQTYPVEKMEWLLVDGGSTDKTVDIIKKYQDKYPIKLLKNEKKLVTYALNIGVEKSSGDYIIRLDAHAEYPTDYIEKCIYYLETTDADNVGGIVETKGEGYVGQINAQILSSKFGVGDSGFRTNAQSGYVDTVPFGAFRKEIFDKIGLFNPELPRSEDNDFNSRIRASGGKVFLANDIVSTYYCRDTIFGLLSQSIKNGNALFLTLKKNPKAMSIRHYIPFLFFLSLIVMPILSLFSKMFMILFMVELFLYLALDLYFCLFDKKVKFAPLKFILYPMFHCTYGLGSFLGLLGIKLY
ncbi:MAG: glycosyltransferase family 2 protein [Clostridia bacterium]|nr:glycosyltransferase family 2 protein [Clostridia bacterium]